VIDEKIKKGRCIILETEKKEKEFKQELTKLQAELTKVQTSGWKRFDGSWQLVYYSGILQSTMERNPNKSKIIQENLDTQNAAFHLLELPFKSWKTVLDKAAALSIENITAAIKTKLLVSKISPFQSNSRR
jgi:exonuclease SbcC